MDNNQLQLLDIIGITTNNLLFSSNNDTLVYSIGSNLIFYNLQKNTKTFIQYYSKNEILSFKYLDNKDTILLSIDKDSNPLICIWELPLFEEIFSQKIRLKPNFNISNIFIEKINSNLFIIIISSIDCNLLYMLKNDNFTNFSLIEIGLIPDLQIEIEGFKCFYDDIYLIFTMNNFLQYYLINTENKLYHNQNAVKLYKKIVFPFKLIGNTLSISDKFEIISFICSKGNCLIYNKNGDSIQSINPLDKEEFFTATHFSGASLCLGSNLNKIYIYNIGDFKMKYFIKETALNSIKLNFQLNNGNNNKKIKNFDYYENKTIEYIYLNEKLDKIFIKMSDNSILLAPLTSLMSDSRGLFNFNSLGNTICLYSYNHSKPINSIEILNNYNEYETVIYTCSKDQTIIQYNVEYNTNKFSNLYFDLKDILNNNNLNGYEENHNNNELSGEINNSYDNIYLTILKFHPFHSEKLYAGDNKGYLYEFDIRKDYFQYKKYIIDNYSIETLSFSKEGNLLCIGLITGKLAIYDINKNLEFCLKLCDNYLSQDEIDFRIENYHIISFSYFFKNENHRDSILFLKDNKNLEYSKLFYDEKTGKLNKKKIILNEFENIILDIKVHISENYLIALNDKNQIIINELNLGETTAVIDLSNQVKKVFNFEIDRSGLYLAVICSLNFNHNQDNNNDLIFFEIGTGNVVSHIKCIGMVFKIIFDYFGKFLIMAGHKGDLSLWKLPYEMSNVIINVLSEIEENKDFWEQFEIKYYNNNNNKNNNENFSIEDENKIYKTENSMKYPDEVFDNGPHKGIQTAGYNDINNNGNQMNNPTNKIYNNLFNDKYKDNYNLNNNVNKDYIDRNSEKFENNKINDINKSIPMRVNNNNLNKNIEYNNSPNNENNNYFYQTEAKDKNNNYKYNSFINIEKNNKYNKTSNSQKNDKFDNYNNNLKNENSLQFCYEKFKKERLMKNSMLKPNYNKKNKNKNLFSSNNLNSTNYKSQNLKSKKINSLSTPKISSSKKYLKNNSQINNNMNLFSKEQFNKKDEEENIDIDLDIDINKIRPNFDPNLYSSKNNQKYSQAIKELIQPLVTSNYDRYFSRYNELENGNQYLNKGFNFENNNRIINEDNYSINRKEKSISESYQKSNKKEKINNAIDILLNNNQKSISSKDISHDLAYINNNKIEPYSNSTLKNINYNNNNNFQSYENSQKIEKSIDFDNNMISSNFKSNSNPKSNNFINNNINNNILRNNKKEDSLSTEKRKYLENKINNFENKLNYYGK